MNNPRIYARPSREWARYQRNAHKLHAQNATFGRMVIHRQGRYSLPPYVLRRSNPTP